MTPQPNPGAVSWRSWAGLVFAPLAWFAHHQAGSNLNYADCEIGGNGFAVAAGLVALAIIAAGGALSFKAWRRAGAGAETKQEPAGRFIAALSLMACALLGLTVAVQITAGLILPSCGR